MRLNSQLQNDYNSQGESFEYQGSQATNCAGGWDNMLRRAFTASVIMITMCFSPATARSDPPFLDVVGGVRSGRVVVTLKKETFQRIVTMAGANPVNAIHDPRAFLDASFKTSAARWSVSSMRPLYERPFVDPALAAQLGLDRVYVLEAPRGVDPQAMSTSFAQSADVEVAFSDTIGGVALVPNDPEFPLQYALDNSGQTAGGTVDADIDAVEAWSIHTGNPGTVTIAIIDSGVSPHSEFSSRLIAGRNTDDPANPNLTIDSCPHGTHVAGIAAAAGDNALGVAGVSWGANIMPVRVLNGCNGLTSNLASGIVWSADNGADVLNMSLQYYNLTNAEIQNLQNAVNYAYGLGTVLIAAAGNNNQGGIGVIAYPARIANVVAVTATDHADTFATFSNQGSMVDVCAPGKDIRSTWTDDGYHYLFGTSMASPHVAGAAALLWSYEPALMNAQVTDLVRFTTDDLGPPGWDQQYGEGRLNVWRALTTVPCFTAAPLAGAAAEEEPYNKSRAVSFQPGNPGQMTALRVRLTSLHHPNPVYTGGPGISYAALEGKFRWVGPPSQYVESTSNQTPFTASTLQCAPYYNDWETTGLLHVFGAEIVPSSLYEVQAVSEGCPTGSSFTYSPALQIVTGRWGDVEAPFNPPAHTQQPDVGDISALVSKFRSAPGAPIKARSVLSGPVPNIVGDVDFGHISSCVDAFRGLGYPYAPPANCTP